MTTTPATYTPGRFVWRELLTGDVAAAKRFYAGLFGWTYDDRQMGPDFVYTVCKAGEREVGGIMDLAMMPDESGDVPPNWSSYVSVPDVDAAAAKAVAAGASLLGDCHDIPGVGRFAVIQDPQGAVFSLFHQLAGDPPDGLPALGEFCWEGLATSAPELALAFYQAVVGWGHKPMAGADTTLLTRVDAAGDEVEVASVTQGPPEMPSHWSTFVAVENLQASNATCLALGGVVLMDRMAVPGFGAFAMYQDPTGAVISAFASGG